MTAPVTPEMLDELERLDAVATIDWQPGVYWPYDDTADIAYGCKLRNAAPALIAAARERDTLAADNDRLRAALQQLADDDPMASLPSIRAQQALDGSMWTTPVAADRPPLEGAKLDPTVTREEMAAAARDAKAQREPFAQRARRCPCCGGKSPQSLLCVLCKAAP